MSLQRSLGLRLRYIRRPQIQLEKGLYAGYATLAFPDSNGPSVQQNVRKCLVTGGTSGIGFATAKFLALKGHSVTIVSRDENRAKTAIQIIQQSAAPGDHSIDYIKAELSDCSLLLEQWRSKKTQTTFPFDTLVNCAGQTLTQSLLSASDQKMAELMAVNLQAPMILSKQLLKDYFDYGKYLKKHGKDAKSPSFCVVNVSSVLAGMGQSGETIYSATKAGLEGFTKSLAIEAADVKRRFDNLPNFRANAICPGFIDTPMTKALPQTHRAAILERIALQKFGTAEDVADGIYFLLQNEYSNGMSLKIDGGLR